MSNLLAKFIAFLEITCHGIILSPAEKLIDNLLRKIYFILTILWLAGKVIIPDGQIVNN